jgi:hypothetical protein
MSSPSLPAPKAGDAAVVSKATLTAAARIDVTNAVLARVIGLSESSVSRLASGAYQLRAGDKAFELALLFVRLFRSLDTIVHGDETAARAWLRSPNDALGAPPLTLMQSVTGLMHVVAYLDARRALA